VSQPHRQRGGRRRAPGRNSALEDGDNTEDVTVDVRWPLSTSRTRSTDLLQRQLSEERERAAGGGERGRPTRSSKERGRV
jgi:hypothetical protein